MPRLALLASLAVAFVLAVGEIGATIPLYPPGGETLPIALHGIEANSPHAYLSAMTIPQPIVLAAPLGVIALVIHSTPE